MNLLHAAQTYHAAGLPLLPNDAKAKYPVGFKAWEQQNFSLTTLERHIRRGGALGLRTGNGIEVIDVDTKAWDGPQPDDLHLQYEELLAANAPDVLAKLVIVRTRSGGRHYLYRCTEVGANQKLAQRPPTESEKARAITLIETRGSGGQVQIAPSPGYTLLQGDYAQIPEITPHERQMVLACARALHRMVDLPPDRHGPNGMRPGDHYNNNGGTTEALDLLLHAGWSIARKQGNTVMLTRPGGTRGHIHATYGHIAPGVFYPFSSNCAPFEPEKAYQPFTVYALLKSCGELQSCCQSPTPTLRPGQHTH
ncbi:bifunctional DNA primase/polymerase [Candidatus Oscillochloris fontis]|uniref:bifunctional DNA primase/polymerase n=1 Tax=Candidatus Oscillochloris fontis TaxID=2496868 RepID=UPI00101B92AB|nr:bifunctional DNA primase/polymerase [Candidatus Oscillochloris fontis]